MSAGVSADLRGRQPLAAERAAAIDLLQGAVSGGGWVLCLGHIQPDGDALGSALACAIAVRAAGGAARVSFDPGPLPFGLPPSLAFLPGVELLMEPGAVPTGAGGPAVVVTFDTGSVERLGQLAQFADGSSDTPVLAVDHHARGNAFGSVRLVDPAAAATAELVAELIDGLGVAFDESIAACLYTGLASDTGSFRYAATTPQTHQLAARLLAAGARHDVISKLLWDTRPASYLKVLSGALTRVAHEGPIIWTAVTAAELTAADASAEDTEGIVDVLRVARDYEVAVVFKEEPSDGEPGGCWKASVRSRGLADVGAACTALGGGGHRLAAGFTAAGQPQQIIRRLRDALAAVG